MYLDRSTLRTATPTTTNLHVCEKKIERKCAYMKYLQSHNNINAPIQDPLENIDDKCI